MRIECVSRIGHKQLGERGLLVQRMEHGGFGDTHDTGSFQGSRRLRPNRWPGEAGFSKKAALLQNGDDGFSALLRDHSQLDLAPWI
jgi:hypothetical protein